MLLASTLAGLCVVLAPVAVAQETGKRSSTPGSLPPLIRTEQPKVPSASPGLLTDRPDDEKAIRAVGDAFTRSFAAGDAKAVAAMFTEDAELIDEKGERVAGATGDRGSSTHGSFKPRPHSTIDIMIESLKFLSPDVAKEEGHTRVRAAGAGETLRRYTVLHVKQAGRWLYSSVREEFPRQHRSS